MPEIGEQDFQALKDQVQALANQLNAARNRLDELEDFATDHIGLDWGATISGIPHPTMLMMHREIHGPSKVSVDATHSATFPVEFDDSISHLHQSKLIVRLSAVRSNVSTAASGGSSSPTSSGGGAHRHRMFLHQSNGTSSVDFGPTGKQIKIDGSPLGYASVTSEDHYHAYNNILAVASSIYRCKDASNNDMDFSVLYDAASEDAYTYDESSTHTHSVTIAAHTHDLTYGIYEGSAASTPQITVTINGVDRTSALGGPWDDDFTVDVTTYLRDANNGFPLRQVNTIVLTSDELLDVEITVKSFASAVPPASIGVQS